jgi:hypothetical protein
VEDCWKEEFPEIQVDEAVHAVVSHSDGFSVLVVILISTLT